MSKDIKLYGTKVAVENDIELYERVVYLYSVKLFLEGKSQTILRKQLVTIMAMYLKFGYSRKTKKEIQKFLPGLSEGNLNNINHDLKDYGFLNEDPMSKKNKHLHPDLVKLKEYTDSVDDNKYLFCFILGINTK